MTSKEIVKKAIHHERPPRLPVCMNALGISDKSGVSPGVAAGFAPAAEGEDEWGCVWKQTEVPNMGQVVGHPLEDISKLDSHPVPDYTDDSRYVNVEESLRKSEEEGKYVLGAFFMVLFERMHMLHGFENTLVDIYADRPAMEALADRVADVHVTLVREMTRRFPGRLDGWLVTDDWGTQQNSFISYDLWMDFFYPRYKRIFDAMHDGGCDVWVHSCGKVNNIIEGYIQAGVTVCNLLQPRVLGIEEIGQKYGGRIAFETGADVQVSLPSGDREKVKADVEALMTHWASVDGGLTFVDYDANTHIGALDGSLRIFMYDEFSKWSQKLYGEPLPPRPDKLLDLSGLWTRKYPG